MDVLPRYAGLDMAAQAGVTAVIQPGDSIRDDDMIAAADEAGIAMLFTGMRHFRHCATPFADLRRLPRDDL